MSFFGQRYKEPLQRAQMRFVKPGPAWIGLTRVPPHVLSVGTGQSGPVPDRFLERRDLGFHSCRAGAADRMSAECWPLVSLLASRHRRVILPATAPFSLFLQPTCFWLVVRQTAPGFL